MTRTKGTRSKGRRQNGRRSGNDTGVARIMQNITRKRMKMRTETKRNYAKKPNRISISEVSEKNALITDRRNARIETENNQKIMIINAAATSGSSKSLLKLLSSQFVKLKLITQFSTPYGSSGWDLPWSSFFILQYQH